MERRKRHSTPLVAREGANKTAVRQVHPLGRLESDRYQPALVRMWRKGSPRAPPGECRLVPPLWKPAQRSSESPTRSHRPIQQSRWEAFAQER